MSRRILSANRPVPVVIKRKLSFGKAPTMKTRCRANDRTVLGDFKDANFTHFGVTSTFYRKDDKFFVRTDGPDGKLYDYEIAYTFGVYPLQQYLVSFPGG